MIFGFINGCLDCLEPYHSCFGDKCYFDLIEWSF